jgi:hypothetical protein
MLQEKLTLFPELEAQINAAIEALTTEHGVRMQELRDDNAEKEMSPQMKRLEKMTQMAESMSKSLLRGAATWKEYGDEVIGTIKEIIAAQVAQAISTAILTGTNFAKSLGPLGLIALPIAIGAAIGAVMTGINQIPGLAAGGIVPAGYPNDTYPAFLTSGERITPPHKLEDNTIAGNVHFQIDGYVLTGLLEKVQRKNNVI